MELPPGAEAVSLLGVDYVRLKTQDGGDLYLTHFGLPLREHLAPENWYAPDWFAKRRIRLEGTSTIYRLPTRSVRGHALDLRASVSAGSGRKFRWAHNFSAIMSMPSSTAHLRNSH
jgi:hypothetical protein